MSKSPNVAKNNVNKLSVKSLYSVTACPNAMWNAIPYPVLMTAIITTMDIMSTLASSSVSMSWLSFLFSRANLGATVVLGYNTREREKRRIGSRNNKATTPPFVHTRLLAAAVCVCVRARTHLKSFMKLSTALNELTFSTCLAK